MQYIINGPEMHQWHHANDRRVFYANFSTKFAIWDWLFGTAFLPDEKPEEYGLYYDYPKDYFLQHVFSVKRVDENRIAEKYRWFRAYHGSRKKVLQWGDRLFAGRTRRRQQEKQRELSKPNISHVLDISDSRVDV